MEASGKRADVKIKTSSLVLVILIANAFRNLGASVVDIGLPNFIVSLSGTLMAYGLVIGMFSITQSIFQFPLAIASDKYGRKLIVLTGMMIYIIGTLLCFFAQDILQLIVFRAIQGAGAYSSILQASIGEIYKKEKHGKGMSYYSFSLALGYFGGIVVGGYISNYLGFRMIFLISAALATFSAFLILVIFKNPERNGDRREKAESEAQHSKISGLKILFKEKQFGLTVIVNSLRWFLFGGVVAYLIWVLEVHWQIGLIETSYLLVIIVASYISFVIFAGIWVDRYSARKILIYAQILILGFGSLFIIVSLTDNLWIFLIASIFTGIGMACIQTAGNSYLLKVIDQIDPELKGSGFGFNNTIGFLCGAIGPIILSMIGEINIFLPYYGIIIIIFISFIITIKFLNFE